MTKAKLMRCSHCGDTVPKKEMAGHKQYANGIIYRICRRCEQAGVDWYNDELAAEADELE